MSLTKVARFSRKALAENQDRIVVVVGDVTDDQRTKVPAGLKICALRVTETLRARIAAAGGSVLTFDQLALQRPRGTNCILIRGKKTARTACKYFGVPGKPGSHVRPRVISKGRKVETARGRW
jgi:large subunit ribosomal protein L18e